MLDTTTILVLAVFVVAVLAWFFALVFMLKMVSARRPGVPLWSVEGDAFRLCRARNLTRRGLLYRKLVLWSVAVFVSCLVIGALLSLFLCEYSRSGGWQYSWCP